MQEGSLRCDVNLSVRKKGTEKFGTRTEMKNLNSFQFIGKAIEYEYKRQVEAIEAGEEIVQETRRFDANTGKTYSMRTKENANDYRYFPDPDLPPIELTDARIGDIKASIPSLPDERKAMYMEKYSLSAYDGEVLTTDIALANYFEAAAAKTKYPKLVANMLLSEVMRLVETETFECSIAPENFASLATLAGEEVINSSTVKKLIKEMWACDCDPVEKVEREGLAQINDEAVILPMVVAAIEANPKSVADYKKGKLAAAKAIIGKVMAASGGKANPVIIQKLVEEKLSEM
jgi:aspartyl-tRNA(Asn)/glutamyl-tRNA(Gln) amidotransferase subunit B